MDEVLSEEVLYRNGVFLEVRRWLKGIHPEKGKVCWGWTGWETVQEISLIRPVNKVEIREKCP